MRGFVILQQNEMRCGGDNRADWCPCKIVVICWNRLGQQPVVVWGEESSMVAFIIEVDVLGGALVHGWSIVECEHKTSKSTQ